MTSIINKLNQNRLASIVITFLTTVTLIAAGAYLHWGFFIDKTLEVGEVITGAFAILILLIHVFYKFNEKTLVSNAVAWLIVGAVMGATYYLARCYFITESLTQKQSMVGVNILLLALTIPLIAFLFKGTQTKPLNKVMTALMVALVLAASYYGVTHYFFKRTPEMVEILTLTNALFFLAVASLLPELIDILTRFIGNTVAWLVLLMVIATLCNVITRKYYGGYSIRLGEMVIIMNIMVFLLASPLLLQLDQHVRVDVFYSIISVRMQAIIDFFGTLFLLLPLCGFIMYYSWGYISRSWHQQEISAQTGGLDGLYFIKSMIVIAFALLVLQGVAMLLRKASLIKNPRLAHTEHHHEELSL